MSKKKLEALFRATFQTDKVTEQAIKEYLEASIVGLKIKNTEIFPGKNSIKAVISSNVIDLLLGTDVSEDDPDGYQRGKSVSFRSRGHEALEEKSEDYMKEISELGTKLSQAQKEIADLKAQNVKLSKKGESSTSDNENMILLQSQIQGLTSQLETFDMERCDLEEKNAALVKELSELKMKSELRNDLKDFSNEEVGSDTTTITKYEQLFTKKQKEFEEEKAILQDKISAMTLKVLDEQEKTADIKKKADLADSFTKEMEVVKAECEKLQQEFESTKKTSEEKDKTIEELNNKAKSVDDIISKNEEEMKKCKKDMSKLKNAYKKLDAAQEELKKQKEEMTAKVTILEDEKKNLEETISHLNAEADQKKKEIEEYENEKKSLNEEMKKLTEQIEETEKKLNDAVGLKDLDIEKLNKEKDELSREIEDLEAKLKKAEENKGEAITEAINKKAEEMEKEYKKNMATAEFEKSRREKELKISEDKREKSDRELIMLNAKFNALEKTMAAKNEELKSLKEASGASIELNNKLEKANKELADLKEINKKLQFEADDRNAAVESFHSLQRQHEIMVKENADLKASVFAYESSSHSESSKEKEDTGKLRIIEEIRQILAEVIYSYKTMDTNSKQFILNYETKKQKINDFQYLKTKLLQLKKKDEVLPLLKNLEGTQTFLKGIPDKMSSLKLINNCLKEIGIKKSAKLSLYNEEIEKYRAMIEVSEKKVGEYEERLALYY